MAACGIPEPDIARVMHIDPKTLRKHYRDELDLGESKANAQVAGFLFNAAKNGNVTAQIFWLKTRARWRETPMELRHSGSIARKDLSEVTDEELLSIIYSVGNEIGLRAQHSRERAGERFDLREAARHFRFALDISTRILHPRAEPESNSSYENYF